MINASLVKHESAKGRLSSGGSTDLMVEIGQLYFLSVLHIRAVYL